VIADGALSELVETQAAGMPVFAVLPRSPNSAAFRPILLSGDVIIVIRRGT
jgi:hypothetical protein